MESGQQQIVDQPPFQSLSDGVQPSKTSENKTWTSTWSATWLLAIIWMVVIFILSSIGGKSLPSIGITYFDKIAHFGVFGLLCLLFYRALRVRQQLPVNKAMLVAAILTSLYGIGDELHQHFTPDRYPDVMDWVADTAGAIAACLFIVCLRKMHERKN